MGYIDKIKLPDNNIYDIKNTIIPVVGTQSAATGNWTGNIDIPHLYNGLTIAYFLPYAPSGNATLNLTLSDGSTTGPINCYYNTSRLTTHYGKGSNIIMTFWGTGSISIDGVDTTDDRWIAQGNYADGNNKTQQTINNNNKDYPLLFSYAERSNTTTNITDITYRNNEYFVDPSDGFIYSKQGFCAGPFKTATAGKRVWVNQNGIYANNYLNGYSVSAYEKAIIKAWPGKHTSADGLLLTIDSGGLTMIGGGESSNNLAGLIDDDQTTTSPKRLDINNSAGASGKETTGFVGNSEELILCSDDDIYFATNCQTIANRVAVCLNNNRAFYPMTDNTGSIGSSNYKWRYGYFGQVYGTGRSYSWKVARDNASFINSTPPTSNQYAPVIDFKTIGGDWSIGSLGTDEKLYFSYVMDSIYSGSDNKSRRYTLEAPDTPDNHTYNILHSGNTSFTQALSSGTKIGSIKINNTSTDIYAPTNTDAKVKQTLRTTNNNYPILLSMYENTNTTTNVTNSVYRNNSVYVNTSVGSLHSNEVCTTKYRVSQYPNAVAMQVLAAGESALVEGEALHIGVSGLPTILRGSVSLVDGDLFFNMKPTGVSEQGEVIYGDESQGLIFKGYRGLYYDESVTPAIKVGNSALCLNLLGDGIYTNTDLNFARHNPISGDMTTYGIILDGNMALKVGEDDTVDFGIIDKDMVLYSTAISADCDVTFSQTLYLSNTTDVAAATYNHPALVIGERDPSDHTMGQHIEFDSNEIMSKTNASTAGILYLQDESGSIQMGCGHITIGKGTVTNTNIVICGKTYKTNTFADNNPKIIFKDADWSQNLSLTFTDFNDVGGNASITLNGNQGGEYFIAPYIKATSGWINPSDRRLKRNIQSLDSRYLDLIKNLNPVSFNFKDEKSDTKTHAGFIAQEVQEAIEKAGLDNEDIAAIIKPYTEEGYYELSYTEFIPMLLLYIKDLEKQIKEIKEKEKY